MVLGSHCAWLTLQDSGLASLERDHGLPTIPPPFSALLFNPRAVSIGKALVEILRSSCGSLVEGYESTA